MVVSVSHSGFWDPKRFFTKLSFFCDFSCFQSLGWCGGSACPVVVGFLGVFCVGRFFLAFLLSSRVLVLFFLLFRCGLVLFLCGVFSFFFLVFRGEFFGVGFPVL